MGVLRRLKKTRNGKNSGGGTAQDFFFGCMYKLRRVACLEPRQLRETGAWDDGAGKGCSVRAASYLVISCRQRIIGLR
jgi:hypothetical protein